ncbi:HAD-IA family hydrolase [Pedobacter sp. UYP1]|jgi:HAD superfamily hydrolase (TIGR01549 family)|uniref:HAD family hydrolase n=1 Tax=Pedobacter sp. UYP1 TaxID=1756396 RepID=UPI003391477E
MLSKYKVILWDFDGVIMDSMPIRSKGFELVLAQYPKEQVDELMAYHELNGGLSRYVKFRYFFEQIRKETITEAQVLELAAQFSEIMLSLLLDEKLLITDSVEFIKANWQKFQMHIVSGSDGKELKMINDELGLSTYFKTISGSPTPKKQLVENVLTANQYDKNEVVLIGDSINDYDAALFNNISFTGYNNPELKRLSENYITQFKLIATQ